MVTRRREESSRLGRSCLEFIGNPDEGGNISIWIGHMFLSGEPAYFFRIAVFEEQELVV